MTQFPYSRQLNRPVRYGKYFTIPDLFGAVVGLVVILPIFGLQTFLGLFGLFFVHLLIFRMGKRPGADVHYFKSLLRPERYRAGGGPRRPRMVKRETR